MNHCGRETEEEGGMFSGKEGSIPKRWPTVGMHGRRKKNEDRKKEGYERERESDRKRASKESRWGTWDDVTRATNLVTKNGRRR